MADEKQTQLQAAFTLKDVSESGVSISLSDCFTVQHYSYECQCKRDRTGMPYGPTLPAYLDFTLKVGNDTSGKEIITRLKNNAVYAYSFLFNATFTNLTATRKVLTAFGDALAAKGYVIDVQESYCNIKKGDVLEEQILISCKVLLSRITYVGANKTLLDSIITND